MFVGVVLGRFLCVMGGMKAVAVRYVSVVGRLFVIARLVVGRGFGMVFCRVLVMFCCFFVVFCTFMVCHFVHLDQRVYVLRLTV